MNILEIFIVEDDPDYITLLKSRLDRSFIVRTYTTYDQAFCAIDKLQSAPLFIIDEMLPDGRGSNLCPLIKKKFSHKSYIIMLTRSSDIESRLNAYQLGADDYVTKPINMLELEAKIKSISERLSSTTNDSNLLLNDLLLDQSQMEAFLIGQDNKIALQLTPKEYLILRLLGQNLDRIYSRENIISRIWGDQLNMTCPQKRVHPLS